jgi:hypothetical protein
LPRNHESFSTLTTDEIESQRRVLSSQPIGFLRPQVLKSLINDYKEAKVKKMKVSWGFLKVDGTEMDDLLIDGHFEDQVEICAVAFANWINESEDHITVRREQMNRLVNGWKTSGRFSDILGGENVFSNKPEYNSHL